MSDPRLVRPMRWWLHHTSKARLRLWQQPEVIIPGFGKVPKISEETMIRLMALMELQDRYIENLLQGAESEKAIDEAVTHVKKRYVENPALWADILAYLADYQILLRKIPVDREELLRMVQKDLPSRRYSQVPDTPISTTEAVHELISKLSPVEIEELKKYLEGRKQVQERLEVSHPS